MTNLQDLSLNARLFLAVNNGWESRWLDPVMSAAGLFGNPLVLLACLLPLLYALDRSSFKRNALGLAGTMLAAAAGGEALKHVFNTPRPLLAFKGLMDAGLVHVRVMGEPLFQRGFPSGHALRAFAAAAFVCGIGKRAGVSLLALAALTALSRLYAGAHFPGDVLGGAFFGVLIGAAAYRASRAASRAGRPR